MQFNKKLFINIFVFVGKDTETAMEEDLRICLVKNEPDIDRRFCFELISPNK